MRLCGFGLFSALAVGLVSSLPAQAQGYYGYRQAPVEREEYVIPGQGGYGGYGYEEPRQRRVQRNQNPSTGQEHVRVVEQGPYGPTIREEWREPDGRKTTRRVFTGPDGRKQVVIDRY